MSRYQGKGVQTCSQLPKSFFQQTLRTQKILGLSELAVLQTIDLFLEGSKLVFVKRDMGPTNKQQCHLNK